MAGLLGAWLFALAAPTAVAAQQSTVRGTVTEENTNAPIAAVNVAVKNGTARVQTNDAGAFTITVSRPTDTLVLTRIGFERVEVPVAGRAELAITMKRSAVMLSEVVVVGYGTQRREDVTGSIVSVDSSRLQGRPSTSVLDALQGASAGISIRTTGAGAEANNAVMVRGRHSITASNEPLVILDGIPYSGPLSEINQADVGSIEILKDASAAAIYGSRGSNGVILITSKKGSGTPRFSYEGYTGIQQIAHMPRMMTAEEFAAAKCVRVNQGQDCASAFTATELANLEAGRSTDWIDLATRTGTQQQHTLSASGGSGGTSYRISGAALDVQGIAENDRFTRYTLGLHLGQDFGSRLKVGTNTQLSHTDRGGISADFEDAFRMNPLTSAFDSTGAQTIYPWREDTFFANPLQGLLATNDDVRRRVFSSNFAELTLPFVEGLTYRINAGLEYANGKSGRYYGRDTRTGFTSGGYAATSNSTRNDWTLENLLRYARVFDNHSIDVTALYGASGSRNESEGLVARGFPNDVLTYFQPNLAREFEPSASITESNLISQMIRLNYSYAGRYLFTFTTRRDGYSGFGTNNKYGVFPSVALGWNVGDEDFWPFGDRFSTLKLRASYGKNGNQAISPYRTLARLRDQSYVDEGTSLPGFLPATLGNPELRWETTTTLNVGADYALLDDRIRGTLDVYRSRTSELLLNRAISPTHGISTITENIGATRNRGIELSLSTINVDRGRFTWTTDFNVAADRSRIADLYGNGEDDLVNGWFIGQPIDVNYGYQFDGIWQEGDDIANSPQPNAKPGDMRVKDVNGDGKIDPQDRTFLGSTEPTYTAGLGTTLRFGAVALSASLYAVEGIVRSNTLLSADNFGDEGRYNTILKPYWTPENSNNYYPANRPGTNLGLPVGRYEDASFIRLKDVNLSYDVPATVARRFSMNSLRLYVNGRNLWTHTDWTGLDPELNSQYGTPLERTFIAGLNVRF